MCRFETSICGCSLQTGSTIVLVYHALLTLNLVVGSALLLQNGSIGVSDYKLKDESEKMLRIVLGLALFTFFLMLVLLVGLIKRNRLAVFVFLIYLSVWMFFVVFGIILSIITGNNTSFIYIIHTVLDIYLWLIVYNYWMELKEEDEY